MRYTNNIQAAIKIITQEKKNTETTTYYNQEKLCFWVI